MHFDLGKGGTVAERRVPFEGKYELVKSRMRPGEFEALKSALTETVGDQDIFTVSWLLGSDWRGTPFQAIHVACRSNLEEAAKFLGQLVWEWATEDGRRWFSDHYEIDGEPISGRTYFVSDR